MASKPDVAKGVGGLGGVLEALPMDRLLEQARDLVSAAGEHAAAVAADKVGSLTDRLADYVENGGKGRSGNDGVGSSPMTKHLLSAGAAGVKGMTTNALRGVGGGGGDGGKKIKVTNIIEEIDVGVPVRVVYNQWTQFQDFPKYTKKLESVEQKAEEKLTWKAGVFLSHRTWESSIVEQVPDAMIVWRSQGEKGHVDGTVTFHELAPDLTRILLVLEYHPQGLVESTGNLWRAPGRRVRLELKHFRRHVMTETILDPDSVQGWRGEIHDGEVVKSHEDALAEEQEGVPEDEYEEEPEDEEGNAEYDEEYDEEEAPQDEEEDEEEPEDEEAGPAQDEYDEEDEEEPEDEPEDEYDADEPQGGGMDDDEEPSSRPRRRSPAQRG